MLDLFKVITVDGAQCFDFILVDLLIIGGGNYRRRERRRVWTELLLLRLLLLLFLRSGRAVLRGIAEILLLFVRHSGALVGR